MKTLLIRSLAACLFCLPQAPAQTTYTNFIRQTQFPTGVQWGVNVLPTGNQPSELAVDPGGARFDLYTVSSGLDGIKSYPLKTCYVGASTPAATIKITGDGRNTIIPETRADQPFYVDISVDGILNSADAQLCSKSVKFLHHVQSYGPDGTGIGIDRSQATLKEQFSISTVGPQPTITFYTLIPGDDLKIRGEERFSIYSLADVKNNIPESEIASGLIKIWPVADGAITGIAQDDKIRLSFPKITFTTKDVYPGATIEAQIYKGDRVDGKAGQILPGSQRINPEGAPSSYTIPVDKYDHLITEDCRWTIQLIMNTPQFGFEFIEDTEGNPCIISFDVDRSLRLNGTFTTIE